MTESRRPSKQFLIRGGIAVGLLAVILSIQTNWFRGLFNKAPLPPAPSNKTIGEFIAQDTNKNGIADWEEKLWGLDPTVLYTNGVPNKEIIEQKKKALGVSANSPDEPENETDALARQLLTITAALGQSGELDDKALAAVGKELANSVQFQSETNHYSLKDLRTVPTTTTSLKAYYDAFAALAAKHESESSELDIIAQALEQNDTSGVAALAPIETEYQRYAKEITALPVPVGIEKQQLEILNSVYGLSVALHYMQQLSDNGANAIAGVALYKINDQRLAAAINDVHTYLLRYGILSE